MGKQLDFSVDGKVRISMVDYIECMFKEFTGTLKKNCNSLAGPHLFRVRIDGEEILLNELQAAELHKVVAQSLFLCKRARPDTQLMVAFMTTRVKKPDTDDWEKLCRLMSYLNATKSLPLILSADDDNTIKWWVDASYAVHPDFCSHTGATMSLGKGAAWSVSTKQRYLLRVLQSQN